MSRLSPNPAAAKGFSLVELMVGMTIGVFVIGAVVAVMINSKATYGTQNDYSDIQETGRFSVHLLSEDLRLAGYWGLNYRPSTINTTGDSFSVSGGCAADAWINSVADPIHGLNNTNSDYDGCISNDDYQDNSDVLLVRHVATEPVDDDEIAQGNIYLRTSFTQGFLFQADDDAVDSAAESSVTEVPVANYALVTNVYFVRTWSFDEDDGIPALVQLSLVGNQVEERIVLNNVEDFQVQYGVDTTGDGSVDTYQDADDVDSWPEVRTVRTEVLVRSNDESGGYTNTNSYTLGDQDPFTPNDSFRRQVFAQTIFVRNSWTS